MTPAVWMSLVSCFSLFYILYYQKMKREKAISQHIKKKIIKRKEGVDDMKKAIELYLGKPIQVTTINGNEIGRLVTYEDDWLTLDYKGKVVRINEEYVVTVRDCNSPVDKKK